MADNRETINQLRDELLLREAAELLGDAEAEKLHKAMQDNIHYDRPELDRQLQGFISHHRRKAATRKIITAVKSPFHSKRLIACACILLIMCGSFLLPVHALRNYILNLFMRDEKVYLHVRLEDAGELKAAGFLYAPGFVPEGYSLQIITKDSHNTQAQFMNGTGDILLFQQADGMDHVEMDKENFNDLISVNGREGYLTRKGDYTAILWEQDGYFYLVSGFLESETLLQIAESNTKL